MRDLFNMMLFLLLVKIDDVLGIQLFSVNTSDVSRQLKRLTEVKVRSTYNPENRAKDYNSLWNK
jgi:hypothetical protein